MVFSQKTHHFVRLFNPTECTKEYGTHDIGRPGKHVRIACKRKDTKKWDTQSYRLPKDEYKVVGNQLKPITVQAKKVYGKITKKGQKQILKKKKDWEVR